MLSLQLFLENEKLYRWAFCATECQTEKLGACHEAQGIQFSIALRRFYWLFRRIAAKCRLTEIFFTTDSTPYPTFTPILCILKGMSFVMTSSNTDRIENIPREFSFMLMKNRSSNQIKMRESFKEKKRFNFFQFFKINNH